MSELWEITLQMWKLWNQTYFLRAHVTQYIFSFSCVKQPCPCHLQQIKQSLAGIEVCGKEALLSLKPNNQKKLICFFTNPLDRDRLKPTSFTYLTYCRGVNMCRNVLQKPTCVTDSSLCSMWDPEHYHDLWTGSVQQKPAWASACLSGAPPPESAALLPSLWACHQEIQHLKHYILAWCIHLQAFLKSYPSIFTWAALFSSTSLRFFSSRSCAVESSCS